MIRRGGALGSAVSDAGLAARLIFCGPFNVVNDDDVDGGFGGLEFEAELFLDCSEAGLQ